MKRSNEIPKHEAAWQKQYTVLVESMTHPHDSIIGRLALSGSLGAQCALFIEELQSKAQYIQHANLSTAEQVVVAGTLELESLRTALKHYNDNHQEEDYQRVLAQLKESTPLYITYLEKFRAELPSNRKLRTLHRFLSDLIHLARQLQYGLQASARWNKKR